MTAKILAGLFVALMVTLTGVYMAMPAEVESAVGMTVSEGSTCCSKSKAMVTESASTCAYIPAQAESTCPDALAACAGGTTMTSSTAKTKLSTCCGD